MAVVRSDSDKWIAGVAGGIAEATGYESRTVRRAPDLLHFVGHHATSHGWFPGRGRVAGDQQVAPRTSPLNPRFLISHQSAPCP